MFKSMIEMAYITICYILMSHSLNFADLTFSKRKRIAVIIIIITIIIIINTPEYK